jgi:4-hydroxy-3-polyprenylbenzoate decarboxylase
MTALSEMGAVIAPPVPAFYARPQTLDEMIDQTLGRVLDLFDLETELVRRWGEPSVEGAHSFRSKPRRRAV